MAFAPKPGCPMCSIVSAATAAAVGSPMSPTSANAPQQPEILWRDDNFTVYRESVNPVSSKGHIVVVFKCVPLVPMLSPIMLSQPT